MARSIFVTSAVIAAMVAGSAALADGHRGGKHDRPEFSELDTDGSGGVSAAELEAHGNARFDQADSNGDGQLSEAELTAAAEARAGERAARRVSRMLERKDENNDGQLSREEMAPRHTPAEMIEHLDSNDDGEISEEEFAQGRHGRGKGRRDDH